MLPQKLQTGQQFKPAVVYTINQIIDYLKTQRLISDNKTIRINQLTAGIAISAIENNANTLTDSSFDFDFPFKMTIGNDENDNQVLHIQTGFLQMNGDDQSRIAISFQPNESQIDESLPLPNETGQYIVTLLCFYDPENEDSQLGWVYRVVYLSSEIEVNQVVNSCGFFSIMIGNILVQQNENNELSYSITKQLINGDFAVFDGNIKYPFKARFMMQEYPENGAVLEEPLKPYYLVINPGKVYINGKQNIINMEYHQLGENPFQKYYILRLNTFTNTAEITISRLEDYVYTEDQVIYNIPICRLILDSNSLCGIIQYIDNNFSFTLNDRKVVLNADDQIPKFLEQKYIIPTVNNDELTEQQQSFYSAFPDNSYLKAVRYSETSSYSMNSLNSSNSNSSIELTGYYDQLYWDYKGISSYNSNSSSNYQTIYNNNNSLEWGNAHTVRINKDDDKPDFLENKIQIDSKLSRVIEISKDGNNNHLKVNSKLGSKTGIITVKNGYWDIIQVPDGKSVLAYNGGLKWARIGNGLALKTVNGVLQLVNICCSSSESNSSSISVSSSESNSSSISVSSSESVSDSISVSSSESNSSSISVSSSESVSDSISVSSSESNSSSISVSSSESVSNSNSNSTSNSGSTGQLIDCSNYNVSSLYVTGTYQVQTVDCFDGSVWGANKFVFHGDTYDAYFYYDDEWHHDPEDENLPITDRFYRSYSCHGESPNYITAYMGLSMTSYSGDQVTIRTYGTYILPWYEYPNIPCDSEQSWGYFENVVSYPTARITVSKNTEN